MRFRFLGTCARDYSPLLKTIYADCVDKNARRSSCALIDGSVMIDCGEHALDSLRIQNIAQSDIDILLITHLHDDHCKPDHIRAIHDSRLEAGKKPLKVYAQPNAVSKLLSHDILKDVDITPLDFLKDTPIKENMTVTALPANHTQCPAHYMVTKREADERIVKMLYACDGAWMMYDTLYALRDKQLDMIVFDGTVGDYIGDFRMAEHNSIPMIRMMLPSLRTFNVYKPEAELYLSHIAPSLHKSHEETVGILACDGLKLAYDGLEIQI